MASNKLVVRVKRTRVEQAEIVVMIPGDKVSQAHLDKALHEILGDDVEWRLLELRKPEILAYEWECHTAKRVD